MLYICIMWCDKNTQMKTAYLQKLTTIFYTKFSAVILQVFPLEFADCVKLNWLQVWNYLTSSHQREV